MLFVQPFFLLIFLPLAVSLFYVARRFFGVAAGLAVIVVASAVFYLPYGPLPFAILAVSLTINLALGAYLATSPDGSPGRRIALVCGLVFNFGNIAVFKYTNQVVAMADPKMGPLVAAVIPAGISFYTFHQVAFLVQAYGRAAEITSFIGAPRRLAQRFVVFVKYAAFVGFFPQLVIGPITLMREFGPQIERPRFGRLRGLNISVAVTLLIVGLFKKVVIADTLGATVDPIYQRLSTHMPISREQAILAICGYFFQLYFDFSGYSDIALGIARGFGLRLPQNFDSPLRATGIVDFYRRWHMTLTRVIVMIIFTPLSLIGTRFAVKRGYKGMHARFFAAWLPFLANFEAIGLWHAAKYTFLLFGLIHSLWYIAETETTRTRWWRRLQERAPKGAMLAFRVAATTPPLALTFALFRSDSIHGFLTLVKTLFRPPAYVELSHINSRVWIGVALVAAIVYVAPNIYQMLRRFEPALRTYDNPSISPAWLRLSWRPDAVWAVFLLALAVTILVMLNRSSPFLYAGF